MGAFYISVSAGSNGRIPVGVAGSVMTGIQRLLDSIGGCLIRRTLFLQGDIPKEVLSRFTLYIDGTDPSVSSSADLRFEGSESMLEEALTELVALFDGTYGSRNYIEERYPDPRCRIPIINSLLSLSEGLGGLELRYSAGGKEGAFSAESIGPAEQVPDGGWSFVGRMAGVLRVSEDGLFLETDGGDIPLEHDDDHSLMDVPCTISGRILMDGGGKAERMTEITNVEMLSSLSFERIISSDKDLVLRNSIDADVEHDNEKKMWTLSNRPLGMSVSKERLDDAVLEFHDQFVFMWEVYDESSDDGTENEFDEEELRLRDYILKVVKDER